jgi:peptidyl-prolyl cis-trans isomerase A (cyclophilin A)
MTRLSLAAVILVLMATAGMAQIPTSPADSGTPATVVPEPATVNVVLQTSLGSILLSIETERAPITAANFLRYVDQKRLDGIGFYRAVKIGDNGEYGLVQAGLRGDPKRVLKPIAHEPTTDTGLSHVSGAISMARLEPGSAAADFFIVLGDLPGMDAQQETKDTAGSDHQGYAVFGRVIEGMDVVRAILEQPRSATAGVGIMQGQMLESPLKVMTVRRAQ